MISSWLQPFTETQANSQRVEARLLLLAAVFLVFYALTLSLSPAARLKDWDTTFLWAHWLGFVVWVIGFGFLHRQLNRRLPNRDPYLLPIGAALMGWGLLTIWRVTPGFGTRQTVWLALAALLAYLVFRLPEDLTYLRRYKYLWLMGGLVLTATTLVLGTNPTGFGPRLWLGCCGVYLQPSEPLKLLLIVYLAAYLADRQLMMRRLVPLLAPTLILIGLAIGLMLAQRDLGTASIFLLLFITVVYFATGRKRFLLIGGAILLLSGLAGYVLYDVIRIRVDAWINPWADPIGRSYQIVQSLLAVAAGGMLGRGPGMGSPVVVPVQHSDFIFASIAEENGLLGTVGLLILIAVFTVRGLRTAVYAPDSFRRYLTIGLVVFLSAQSILIIGGNLRLLPLTGVTLPFVSYGGSSLLTSTLALAFILIISNSQREVPAPLKDPTPILVVGALLLAGVAGLAIVNGWWAFVRGPELLTRTDNPRRALSDLYVVRGSLLDREDGPLAVTTGNPGEYERLYLAPTMGPVLGYVHPRYGLAGVEDTQDDYLRGLASISAAEIWWNHILYGHPPPGLNVRQTINPNIQSIADALLADERGALVLLNAETGEILAMASHPTFNPNQLEETWESLIERQDAPLLNRASQGQYPLGNAAGPLLLAAALNQNILPTPLNEELPNTGADCAFGPDEATRSAYIRNGCAQGSADLPGALGAEELANTFTTLGFFQTPLLRMPASSSALANGEIDAGAILVSPLQLAMAVATLSNSGIRPAPRIATAVQNHEGVWNSLSALGEETSVFSSEAAGTTQGLLATDDLPLWESTAIVDTDGGDPVTWYLAGTGDRWQGAPLAVVLVLEQPDAERARDIGREIILAVIE